MLQDSVTIVLIDEKGKPVTGNDAIKLRRSNKKVKTKTDKQEQRIIKRSILMSKGMVKEK